MPHLLGRAAQVNLGSSVLLAPLSLAEGVLGQAPRQPLQGLIRHVILLQPELPQARRAVVAGPTPQLVVCSKQPRLYQLTAG